MEVIEIVCKKYHASTMPMNLLWLALLILSKCYPLRVLLHSHMNQPYISECWNSRPILSPSDTLSHLLSNEELGSLVTSLSGARVTLEEQFNLEISHEASCIFESARISGRLWSCKAIHAGIIGQRVQYFGTWCIDRRHRPWSRVLPDLSTTDRVDQSFHETTIQGIPHRLYAFRMQGYKTSQTVAGMAGRWPKGGCLVRNWNSIIITTPN